MKSFAFSHLFTHLLEITKASPPIRVTAAWQKTITQAKALNLMVPSKSREKRVSKPTMREIRGGGSWALWVLLGGVPCSIYGPRGRICLLQSSSGSCGCLWQEFCRPCHPRWFQRSFEWGLEGAKEMRQSSMRQLCNHVRLRVEQDVIYRID